MELIKLIQDKNQDRRKCQSLQDDSIYNSWDAPLVKKYKAKKAAQQERVTP